ncbi:MAG: hypothetical protein AABY50_08125 [Nitrospirota bacterium]|mgnify:FL=1
MATQIAAKKIVSISKSQVDKKGGIVVLSLKEYQKLCERAVPTYYLKGEKACELDKLVAEGLAEYSKGRCKKVKSLSDLD